MIVRQFHDVIKVPAGAADMKDVDKTGMRARDGLENRHTFELALKSAFAFEGAAMDHFHRS